METVWTETSITTFEDILEYINNKWSKKEAEAFYNRTMQVIESITVYNEIGKKYLGSNVYRQFLISKQTYLFYSIRKDILYIHLFWNNAQDPDTLRKILGY